MYTVIISSLGRINYLNELLQSIYNQTLLPEEIIILLDQNKLCKDNEKLILKKKNCKVVFCNKFNLSQKRNFGAEITKTNYIIYSDDDDIWEFNKGELTIKSLKNSQIVCHDYTKFGEIYQKPKFILGKKPRMVNPKDLLFGSNIFGGGSGIAGRKEIFLSLPFDEHYLFCEDFFWWTKVILAEIKIKYLPYPLVKYRTHKNNMTSNFFKIYFFNIKIFRDLIIKSFILFIASLYGFLKSTLKSFFLLLFYKSRKK